MRKKLLKIRLTSPLTLSHNLILYSTVTLALFFALTLYTLFALKNTAVSQVRSSLIDFTNLLGRDIEENSPRGYHFPTLKNNNIRLTLINSQGVVIADNFVRLDLLDNHKDRAEVLAAFNNDIKHTCITRNSSTLMEATIYYALLIHIAGNPYVLRAACPVSTTIFNSKYFKMRFIIATFVIFTISMILIVLLFLESATNIDKKLLLAGLKQQRAQSDFVANASHELKTPITSILGFAETLMESDLDSDEYNFAYIIYQQSKRLTAIIDDLLLLSSLPQAENKTQKTRFNNLDLTTSPQNDFAKRALKTAPCALYSIIQTTLDNFALQRLSAGITFIFTDFDKSLTAALNTDLFTLALSNIFNNALKYCPKGSIVSISLKKDTAPNNKRFPFPKKNKTSTAHASLIISDNGPGIPPGAEKYIFDRFYRVDKGRSRAKGGTGLGLALTRRIIELHNGSITATSHPDGSHGLTFIIKLPLVNLDAIFRF